MRRRITAAGVWMLIASGMLAASVEVDTSPDRARTNLSPGLRQIGVIQPRHANEIEASNWTLGCETLCRDYADYEQYKKFLAPLGIKTIRLQGGWAKTEKEKGRLDFSWLDRIIHDARGRGLSIWLETSYGNPIYPGGGGKDLANGFPTSEEALAAWDRWVEALATRYKGKVRDWSMWNEPDINKAHTPEKTAVFNIRTAEIIKRVIPDARIAGLVMAGIRTSYMDGYLKCLSDNGKLGLFHWIVYHGYTKNPDTAYPDVEKLKTLLAEYSPSLKLRQGENGCPSELATRFALSNHPWTETSQAKWDLRRMLGDLGHDIESSVFTICDFNHTGREINRKGLLRATADKKVEKIKLAYYAVQNTVAVFDSTLVRVTDDVASVEFPRETACFVYRNSKTGGQLLTIWDSSAVPSDTFETSPARIIVKNCTIEDPVWVDLISGRVCEIPEARVRRRSGAVVFDDIPIYDGPVLVAERRLVLK